MAEFANYWRELDDDEASSTIAWFQTGAEATVTTTEFNNGEKVLVWKGIEVDAGPEIQVESHHSSTETIPEDAEFVIECLDENDELTNEYFESSFEDAIKTAQQLTEGELPRKVPSP